jgi:hypothetical protein
MRGLDERTRSLFSYVDLEDRLPAKHPLRVIRRIVNDVLAVLDGEFAKNYADSGRPSIPPERLLRALLLQAFYTIRSETQLIKQLDYNLLYRWFVGLGVPHFLSNPRCLQRVHLADHLDHNDANRIEHSEGPLEKAILSETELLFWTQMQSPAEVVSGILGTRIQRNSQAERLLTSRALGPLKCSSNFSRWRFLPSKHF